MGKWVRNIALDILCGRVDGDMNNCKNPKVYVNLPIYSTSSYFLHNRNAYTVPPPLSEYGTVIVFCPQFFNLSFTDIITSTSKKDTTALAEPTLYTFERTIMHEWMHCDPMGFKQRSQFRA